MPELAAELNLFVVLNYYKRMNLRIKGNILVDKGPAVLLVILATLRLGLYLGLRQEIDSELY